MSLCIIIPAYNEEKRIGTTLEKYLNFFKNSSYLDKFEILIVLNGCKDKTLDIVKLKKDKYKEIKYLNFKESGKGFAITLGFKDALLRNHDFIGFTDADGATPPEAFYNLLMNLKNSDGVIGNRWDKDSLIKARQPFLRRFMSRTFNFLTRSILFLNYRDTQCGAKLFKRKALESVVNNLGKNQWAFDIELLYKLKIRGFKIKEIPTIWDDKKGSKLNVTRVPLQMFASIIRIRLIYSPFKRFINLYDSLPEKYKIHKIYDEKS